MNKRRDTLKKKLAKEIDSRRDELNRIFREESIERSKSLVGKCFSEYHDTGDNFTRYMSIASVNEFGTMRGYYFDVYDNRVAFSERDVYIPHDESWILKNSDEILQSEFDKRYSQALDKIK